VLNSYDIHGLSAIISRTGLQDVIRYILGATGEGRHQLRLDPGAQLSDIDYLLMEKDENVRARLLSNPVFDDLLHLFVYCHRPYTRGRLPTPRLRENNYLCRNAMANWASTAAPGTLVKFNPASEAQAPRPDTSKVVFPSTVSPASGRNSQHRLRPQLTSDLTHIPPPPHICCSSPAPYLTS